jgi:hypothetical protein
MPFAMARWYVLLAECWDVVRRCRVGGEHTSMNASGFNPARRLLITVVAVVCLIEAHHRLFRCRFRGREAGADRQRRVGRDDHGVMDR